MEKLIINEKEIVIKRNGSSAIKKTKELYSDERLEEIIKNTLEDNYINIPTENKDKNYETNK